MPPPRPGERRLHKHQYIDGSASETDDDGGDDYYNSLGEEDVDGEEEGVVGHGLIDIDMGRDVSRDKRRRLNSDDNSNGNDNDIDAVENDVVNVDGVADAVADGDGGGGGFIEGDMVSFIQGVVGDIGEEPIEEKDGNGGGGGGGANDEVIDALMHDINGEHCAELIQLYEFNAFVQMHLNEWQRLVRRLTNDQLRQLINRFYEFTGGADKANLAEAMERMFPRAFCCDPIRVRFLERFYEIRYLYLNSCIDFRKSDAVASADFAIIDEAAALQLVVTEDDLGRLAAIYQRIRSMADIAMQYVRLDATFHPKFHPIHAANESHYVVSNPDFVQMPVTKQALLWVMHRALDEGVHLVIVDGRRERTVYVPRIYNHRFTHTFVPFRCIYPLGDAKVERKEEMRSTVSNYLYHLASDPVTDGKSYDILHSQPTTIANVSTILNSGQNPALPILVPDRHVFSFINGVYDAANDIFYDYEVDRVPQQLVAIKFFEREFVPYPNLRGPFYRGGKPVKHDCDMPADIDNDWYDIPTPNFDKIFRTHITNDANASYRTDDPELVLRFNFAFLGRLLFDVGERDNLQRTYVIIGGSNSGKSVVTDVAAEFYPAQDVRVTGDHHEEKFGLSALHGGKIWMIKDCGKNSSFSMPDFLSMTTGEEVSVREKFVTAFTVRWTSPGIVVGNAFFARWVEEPERLHAILRRLIYIKFANPVAEIDLKLGEKVKAEIPLILLKIARAYRGLAEFIDSDPIRNGDIRRWWPEFYENSLNSLLSSLNALQAFIMQQRYRFFEKKECHEIRAEFVVPWTDFRAQYRQFCKDNTEFKDVPLNVNQLPDLLRDRGVFTMRVTTLDGLYPQPEDADAHIAALRKTRPKPRASRNGEIVVLCGIIDSRPIIGGATNAYSNPMGMSMGMGSGGASSSSFATPQFVSDTTTTTTTTSSSSSPSVTPEGIEKLLGSLEKLYTTDDTGKRLTAPISQIQTQLGMINHATANGRTMTMQQRTALQTHRQVLVQHIATMQTSSSSSRSNRSSQP